MSKKLIRKLQVGFGISLLILILSSSASYISIRSQINNRAEVIKTQQKIKAGNQILIDLQNAETGLRGYLLTGRASFLEPFYESLASLPQSISDCRQLVANNRQQVLRVDSIDRIASKEISALNEQVAIKKSGGTIIVDQLEQGKTYMDRCRSILDDLIDDESARLASSSDKMHDNSTATLWFILFAAAVSLFITIYFYLQIRDEFKKREKMQQALREKDEHTSRRLNIIQQIAHEISKGDYSVRVSDEQEDDLGSLAASLNHMASSLEVSFDNINNNEWRQAGLAQLNEILIGNKTEEAIAKDALEYLVGYGGCVNGAFYLLDKGSLQLQGAYALEGYMRKQYAPGEGMIGQVFRDREVKTFSPIAEDDFVVSFAAGQLKVKHIAVIPMVIKGQCMGVIELGSNEAFGTLELDFLNEAARIIALEVIAAKGRKHIQSLLEETQAQTEELQTQQSELENLNAELEAQTQKLQASEEELRVQQEELLQSNQELEERSKLLEEKNILIAHRNSEIQKKAEELALSTKYKSEFLANMSHELRTPLNSILLLSRLMVENGDENLTADQVESAKVIQSSGSSLLSLIDEILDLSKIEAGKMELEYKQIDLTELKNDLYSLFAPVAKDKGLDFGIEITSEVPATLNTDKLRLEQILRNLLSNAIKFTQEGSVQLSVSQPTHDADFLHFIVKDTGIGISEENRKIIFEAFQQADGSTRRKFGGTGLGLSISRELARLLGGEITVESEMGSGSHFTLAIPLKEVRHTHKDQEEQTAAPAFDFEAPPDGIDAPKPALQIPEDVPDDRNSIQSGDKVILIVEDDTNFAKALLKFTHKQHYKGVIVVRGDLAVQAAENYQPLAILLDIQLPVKNGWEVMDELKANAKTRHIPVHIMSSLKVKKESLLKGAIDFINKPIALEQMGGIFKKIEHALTRNPKKVLIVEENPKHATALSYFLSNFNITSEIKTNVEESINALASDQVNCVILDMGVPDKTGYETLEAIKQKKGLEDLPIIIFTGKNLSHAEEMKIRQYADSIVIKTAHSFQRILDEVGLFLHLVEESHTNQGSKPASKLGALNEVLKEKTVLIADDDVRNIFSLTKTLENYQMKVISAIDGKEALQQLKNHPGTTVILMDMMMPEMDGYETIQQIRNMPAYKKLPIIAVTAKAMTGDREKCIQAGASDYISKPVDKDQLLSLLRVWLYEN
ncbi:response regulator [Niabella insulamsoli]|uniref:response regulator n=1 Tax=Niabella insulamsoli TaxID=3144874 RepID=UPI0031FD019C